MFAALAVALSAMTLTAFQSCSSSGCTENRNAVPLAEFLNPADDKVISVDSISISGVGQPGYSILSQAGQAVSQVYLPMRPTHETVSWCFAYKWKQLDYPELNDTITFDYKSIPFFASEECGAYYKYHITRMDYTDHLIERVEILDSMVTNVDKVYVNIYFRVADGEQ